MLSLTLLPPLIALVARAAPRPDLLIVDIVDANPGNSLDDHFERTDVDALDRPAILPGGGCGCEDLCPYGSDALECAAAWEEVVPCSCECHAPIAARPEDVHALVGTSAGVGPWARTETDEGVWMTPAGAP